MTIPIFTPKSKFTAQQLQELSIHEKAFIAACQAKKYDPGYITQIQEAFIVNKLSLDIVKEIASENITISVFMVRVKCVKIAGKDITDMLYFIKTCGDFNCLNIIAKMLELKLPYQSIELMHSNVDLFKTDEPFMGEMFTLLKYGQFDAAISYITLKRLGN